MQYMTAMSAVIAQPPYRKVALRPEAFLPLCVFLSVSALPRSLHSRILSISAEARVVRNNWSFDYFRRIMAEKNRGPPMNPR